MQITDLSFELTKLYKIFKLQRKYSQQHPFNISREKKRKTKKLTKLNQTLFYSFKFHFIFKLCVNIHGNINSNIPKVVKF